jgi:hypothetical protein
MPSSTYSIVDSVDKSKTKTVQAGVVSEKKDIIQVIVSDCVVEDVVILTPTKKYRKELQRIRIPFRTRRFTRIQLKFRGGKEPFFTSIPEENPEWIFEFHKKMAQMDERGSSQYVLTMIEHLQKQLEKTR